MSTLTGNIMELCTLKLNIWDAEKHINDIQNKSAQSIYDIIDDYEYDLRRIHIIRMKVKYNTYMPLEKGLKY